MPAKPSALLDTRVIYCGDNLDQLRKLPEGCVDLIYIDPPFNSNRIRMTRYMSVPADHRLYWRIARRQSMKTPRDWRKKPSGHSPKDRSLIFSDASIMMAILETRFIGEMARSRGAHCAPLLNVSSEIPTDSRKCGNAESNISNGSPLGTTTNARCAKGSKGKYFPSTNRRHCRQWTADVSCGAGASLSRRGRQV